MKPEQQHSELRKKILCAGGFFALFYVVVLARAYQLQILGDSRLNDLARSQHKTHIFVQPKRGAIFDRNGESLAMDVRVSSVAVHPRQLDETEKPGLLKFLKKHTSLSLAEIDKKMSSPKKFEWVERRIPLSAGNAIAEKKFKGVQIIDEFRRYYPNKHLAGQLLGAVGYDAKALGGIEMQYDRELKSGPKRRLIERDARGQFFRIRNVNESTNDIYLTIDINIQLFAEQALVETARKHKVKSGFALVLDVKSGDILAMANYPSFNPNLYWKYNQEFWKNHAAIDVFEPGSTFKTILVAAALESGKVRPQDQFFCENGAMRIGKHVINDHGHYGLMTTRDIIKVSSNIGVTKIAQKIGKREFYDYMKLLGIGESANIGVAGEGRGSLRDWQRWMDIEFSNIAFGQGVSVTGVQMVAAYNAIANEGEKVSPRLVTKIVDSRGKLVLSPEPAERKRVLSRGNAQHMKDMLHSVTQAGGTALAAHVKGYLSGGKTGTAQKVDSATKSYAKNQYVSSFIGFSPLDDPQILVYVVYDTPRANGYYGGVVAAPVFRNIVENTMGYLGIPPRFAEPEQRLVRSKNVSSPNATVVRVNSGMQKTGVSYEMARADLGKELMPDLKGLSLRTVMQLAHEKGVKIKVNGSGFVNNQIPKAGVVVSKQWAVSLAGM